MNKEVLEYNEVVPILEVTTGPQMSSEVISHVLAFLSGMENTRAKTTMLDYQFLGV